MRKSLTAVLTLAALAAVAVPASATAAQNTKLHVFVSNCEKQVYKPKSITAFCADAGVIINKVKYSSYGAKQATGTGVAAVNLCEPNCAAGKTKNFKVRFKLSRVTQCGDSYQFRRLKFTYTGKDKPKGNRTESTSYVCADAPTA
jgi:hypothetical protein